METLPLTPQDHELIAQTKSMIARCYRPDHHHVGAALVGYQKEDVRSVCYLSSSNAM